MKLRMLRKSSYTKIEDASYTFATERKLEKNQTFGIFS